MAGKQKRGGIDLDAALKQARQVVGLEDTAPPLSASKALSNVPSSYGNLARSVYQTVRHPIDTASGIWDVATGGARAAAQAVLPKRVFSFLTQFEDPKTIARVTKAASAAGEHYARYGSVNGIRRAIENDPVGTAADLSALLSGGEMALSRVAPEASATLRAAARLTNPATPLIKTLPYVPGVTRATTAAIEPFRKLGAVQDAEGNLTPAASAAIKASGIDPSLFDKGLTQTWASIAKTKGVSPASAREALLRHTGAPVVTRGMAVGEKATEAVPRVEAGQARVAAEEGIKSGLESKAPETGGTPVGQDFISSKLAAQNKIRQAYDTVAEHPGTFAPESVEDFFPKVQDVIKRPEFSGLPATTETLQRTGRLPLTNAVLFGGRGSSGLIGGFSDMAETTKNLEALPEGELHTRLTAPDALTMAGVDNLRREITHAFPKAAGDDIIGLRALSTAVDEWVADQIAKGNFSGDGKAVMSDMETARKANADYSKTFSGSPNPAIRAATKLVDKYTEHTPEGASLGVETPENLAATVQDTLQNAVVKPGSTAPVTTAANRRFGAQTYEELTGPTVEGGPTPLSPEGVEALHDYLRGSAYRGNLGRAPLEDILNGPFGHLFSDEDKIALRQHATANDLLGAPAGESSLDVNKHWLRKFGTPAVGAVAGTQLGNIASHYLPALPPGVIQTAAGTAGGYLGNALNNLVTSGEVGRKIAAEMAGAPVTKEPLGLGALASPAVASAARTAPAVTQLGAMGATPTPLPVDENKPLTPEQIQQQLSAPTPAVHGESTEKPLTPEQIQQLLAPEKHASGGRVARKAGGAVKEADVERLVQRLMHHAKKARKATTKHTEPLLKHDDSTIMSALNAAKRSI